MSASRTLNWILTILLIILIIMSGVSIYYSSAILGKLDEISSNQDKYYSDLMQAIAERNVTKKPTLTVFSLWGGSEEQNFLQCLGNFTELTGINVTHYHYTTEDLLVGVPMQLRAGSSIADVIIAPWPAWIMELTPYLVSVNDLIDASKYPNNTISAVKDENGVIWAGQRRHRRMASLRHNRSFYNGPWRLSSPRRTYNWSKCA